MMGANYRKPNQQEKMNTLKLITWTLRMVLSVIVLITSAISMTYSEYDVWIAVFCLALLNIVDLADKEI